MRERLIAEYLQGAGVDSWRALGAHPSEEGGQNGVRFTVYAPHAQNVSLIGGCNGWQEQPMARTPDGMWSLFVPGVPEGTLYKFRVVGQDGETRDRIDPFAFSAELRPNTASAVCRVDRYAWGDGEWMTRRGKNIGAPMHIYEVHAGSWRRGPEGRFLRYGELARELLPYVKEMGYTHVEFLPLTEHPLDASWGYQPSGFFSATSRYGAPEELMQLVDLFHQAGIGVIFDLVPVHFLPDDYALQRYDGSRLYESENEAERYTEWGTLRFDYAKPHVCSFLRAAMDFWACVYHADGLRYDAVSRLLYPGGDPARGVYEPGVWFLKSANYALRQRYPGLMLLAEDSSYYEKVTAPVEYGGLGFDYKWDFGWMNDTLSYFALPPQRRGAERNRFLQTMDPYFYRELYLLPLSHDEVVHGKGALRAKCCGNTAEQLAQARALMLHLTAHPGKKLSFMGSELALQSEWDENRALDWSVLERPEHRGFQRCVAALNRLYREEPALYREDYNSASFSWMDRGSRPGVFAYERRAAGAPGVAAVLNLSPHPLAGYELPAHTRWTELLNTDAAEFGGSGVENRQPGCALRLAPYSGCLLRLS